ncbi:MULTISPECIES: hypothetical protein [Exiguobacterium]|uniref:Uncharacterized protein n=2 Tax=Exiguobacterium TaxID=33986 RepID=A0ABX8GE38_EXIAC|nr:MULTISPECIES: hypothetical protein [Exiguobacterium]QWB31335.1 hypothetical protein KKI46_06705 [Exiguobacterium acetylicum]
MDNERKRIFKYSRYNRRTIQIRWIIGILAVVIIGGSYFLGMHTKSSQVKKETPVTESKTEKAKQKSDTPVASDPRDLASFGHGTNVEQTNNDFSPKDVQNALDTGKPVVEKAISSTTELVNRIVKEQKKMKETEQLRIKDFQKTVTQDVRDRVDAQVEILNEAAQIAHMMAAGAYMAKNEDVPFTNVENVIAEKLEPLSQNLLDIAYSLETYTVSKSFETWDEAENYLPNREEKTLRAIPLNEAIFNASSSDATETSTDASNVMNEDDGELIAEFLDGQFQLTAMLKEADDKYYEMSLEYPAEGDDLTTGDSLSLMVNGMSEKIIGIQKSPTADGSIKHIANTLSTAIIEMQSTASELVSSERLLKSNEMETRQDGYYRGQEAIQNLNDLNSNLDTSGFTSLDLPTPDINGN